MTDLRKNSWLQFRKALAESGYNLRELSNLYRKHTAGEIKLWELKKPQILKKYLTTKSKTTNLEKDIINQVNKISKRNRFFSDGVSKFDSEEASRLMLWIEDGKPEYIAKYLTKEYVKLMKMNAENLVKYTNDDELSTTDVVFYLALLELNEPFYTLVEKIYSSDRDPMTRKAPGGKKIGGGLRIGKSGPTPLEAGGYLLFLMYDSNDDFREYLDKTLGQKQAHFYAIRMLLKSDDMSEETLYGIKASYYVRMYDKEYERLETECEGYKTKILKLEHEILKLKYAPGGSKFQKLKQRAVSRGMKK